MCSGFAMSTIDCGVRSRQCWSVMSVIPLSIQLLYRERSSPSGDACFRSEIPLYQRFAIWPHDTSQLVLGLIVFYGCSRSWGSHLTASNLPIVSRDLLIRWLPTRGNLTVA